MNRILAGFAIWAVVIAAGCSVPNSRNIEKISELATSNFSESNSPTYSWLKKNIFGKHCAYCHTGRRPYLLDYKSILTVVTPGDPANSRLFYMVSTGRMPKGAGHLSPEKKMAIYYWIASGAKNN